MEQVEAQELGESAPVGGGQTAAADDRALMGRVLAQGSVDIHFQPLASPRSQSVVGVEALARGVNPDTGELIPPAWLFSQAARLGRLVELDRMCRERALAEFAGLACRAPELVLFLNFEASLLDSGVEGSGRLGDQVRGNGLTPSNVVIEMVESRVSDLAALERFSRSHRDRGFLLALDDMGAGHSNLDRVAIIKPDVIKLDRSLVNGLDRQWYKQEIAGALVNLAQKIGALVVAEGVERRSEALAAMDLGADILQGFYLAKPMHAGAAMDGCPDRLAGLAQEYRSHTIGRIAAKKARHSQFDVVVADLRTRLWGVGQRDLDTKLCSLLGLHPSLECIYVLGRDGRQVSDTVCDHSKIRQRRKVIFRPADKGDDQSLKNYYLLLMAGLERYVSEPYISLASGNLCVTISTWFKDRQGRDFILCADFDYELLATGA